MDIENVEAYLGCNYGRHSLVTYRSVKKYYFRVESVQLDIYYLTSCRSKNIIPGFLWFKTANQNLASSSEYKESQRRLLNAEIKYKHQHLKSIQRSYQASLDLLQTRCPENIFQNLKEIVVTICKPMLKKKQQTIDRKLYKLGYVKESKPAVNPKVVTNLSTRTLSEIETNCLAHGLDYGLLPKHFDNMNAIGNIERFFHRVTDVFQKQKKLMADFKERDKIVQNDIRLVDSKQLTLAYNLRSLTDSFKFQAKRYQQEQHRIQTEQAQYHHLLKELKEDKSIVITRPDKGRGVVLLDRNDYVSKMNVILDDKTKFKCLSEDLTISRENSLTTFLRRLLNQGQISDEIYDMARPSGSNPGRLYGLPKIHKKDQGIPLRPVLSSIGTYNYGLAKVLKQMLSTMVQNETVIKNSFSFVKELKSLPKSASEYKMVSFDIVSLYTNIPIDRTIDIILKHLYDDQVTKPSIKRNDMKKLLEYATKSSHFMFNGKIYDQIDGVSMGSPLAPLLAEIFLQNFEKTHLPAFEEKGIFYWKRYVDDTFVLLDPTVSVKDICSQLSKCDPALKFTEEEERINKRTLSFLDILIQRQPGVGFRTRVYRKPTFSGLLTKWKSFVPKAYKYNAVSSMVYRAIKICSTYETLNSEFKFIKKLTLKNGYPLAFVESIIKKQLDLVYEPRPIKPPELETDVTVLRIPYYRKPSQIYAKRVTAAVSKQYPSKKIRVVYDVTARIGQNFTTKDKIPTELKSGVVYEAACSQCNDKYIGKTCRHLKTRIKEHLYDQRKILFPTTKPSKNISHQKPPDTKTIPNHNFHMKTRSQTRITQHTANQRKLLPKPPSFVTQTIRQNNDSTVPTTQPTLHPTTSQTRKTQKNKGNLKDIAVADVLMNTVVAEKQQNHMVPKSALTKHYVATGHTFTDANFKIILSDHNRYRLLIKESLLIRQREPKLNGTDRSLPLYIYPDGLQKIQTDTSNAGARRSTTHMDTGTPGTYFVT